MADGSETVAGSTTDGSIAITGSTIDRSDITVGSETQSQTQQTCAICLIDMTDASELARPSVCQHLFCRVCLENLCISGIRQCPLDRFKFDEICIRGRDESNEVVLKVNSIRLRFFTTSTVALAISGLLTAALWASPSWLLLIHIVSVVIIYLLSKGKVDERFYMPYCAVLYGVLVPAYFIGITITVYAFGVFALLMYWQHQLSQLSHQNGDISAEKRLMIVTSVLLCVLFPAITFPWYTVAQSILYSWCAVAYLGMQINVHNALGQHYTRYILLFSSLVMVPYLCQLSELTLPYLLYNGMLPICLDFLYRSTTVNGTAWIRLLRNDLFWAIVQLAPVLLLGYSHWIALNYAFASHIWAFLQLNQQSVLTRVISRMPLLVTVNLLLLVIVLPWRIHDLKSVLFIDAVLICSGLGLQKLLATVNALSNSSAIFPILDLIAFGILVPAVMF